jgi:hypothetical protein
MISEAHQTLQGQCREIIRSCSKAVWSLQPHLSSSRVQTVLYVNLSVVCLQSDDYPPSHRPLLELAAVISYPLTVG